MASASSSQHTECHSLSFVLSLSFSPALECVRARSFSFHFSLSHTRTHIITVSRSRRLAASAVYTPSTHTHSFSSSLSPLSLSHTHAHTHAQYQDSNNGRNRLLPGSSGLADSTGHRSRRHRHCHRVSLYNVNSFFTKLSRLFWKSALKRALYTMKVKMSVASKPTLVGELPANLSRFGKDDLENLDSTGAEHQFFP